MVCCNVNFSQTYFVIRHNHILRTNHILVLNYAKVFKPQVFVPPLVSHKSFEVSRGPRVLEQPLKEINVKHQRFLLYIPVCYIKFSEEYYIFNYVPTSQDMVIVKKA